VRQYFQTQKSKLQTQKENLKFKTAKIAFIAVGFNQWQRSYLSSLRARRAKQSH